MRTGKRFRWALVWLSLGPLVLRGQDQPGGQEGVATPADVPHVVRQAPVPAPAPAVVEEPPPQPEFTVLDRVEYVVPRQGRSIFAERVEPPVMTIPDPPPPPPEIDRTSLEFLARHAQWLANRKPQKSASISVTVYDHRISHLRWVYKRPPADGEAVNLQPSRLPRMRVVDGAPQAPDPSIVEYEAFSNVDWNCFRGVRRIEAWGTVYDIMLGIGDINLTNVDTARLARLGRKLPEIPPHPPLPAEVPGFTVSKGDATCAEATVFVRAMHEVYRNESAQLWADWQAREEARIAYDAWLKANPPQPQDVLVRFWSATPEQAAKIRKLVP